MMVNSYFLIIIKEDKFLREHFNKGKMCSTSLNFLRRPACS